MAHQPPPRMWRLTDFASASDAPPNLAVRLWPSNEKNDEVIPNGWSRCTPDVVSHVLPPGVRLNNPPVGRIRWSLSKTATGEVRMLPQVDEYARTRDGHELASHDWWTALSTDDNILARQVFWTRDVRHVHGQDVHLDMMTVEVHEVAGMATGNILRRGTVLFATIDVTCDPGKECKTAAVECVGEIGWEPTFDPRGF